MPLHVLNCICLSVDLKRTAEKKRGRRTAGWIPSSSPLGTHLVQGLAGPDTAGCCLWWPWCPPGAARWSGGQNPIAKTRKGVNEEYVYHPSACYICYVQDFCPLMCWIKRGCTAGVAKLYLLWAIYIQISGVTS